MQFPYLFEFIDVGPRWLIETEQELLEACNSFSGYYQWVAKQVVTYSNQHGFNTMVELGAGTAPVIRVLAGHPEASHLILIPSNIRPPKESYIELQKKFPSQVLPSYNPVDFMQKQAWDKNTLLVLSAAFHHIPLKLHSSVLETLLAAGGAVLIVEPLRKTTLSLLYCFLGLPIWLLLPVLFINRKHGKLRRLIWCWLCPLAPLAITFDGIISCLRMNNIRDWGKLFQSINLPESSWSLTEGLIWQAIFVHSD